MPVSVAQRSEALTPTFSKAGSYEATELFGDGKKEHPTCCGISISEPGSSSTITYPGYQYGVVLEGEAQFIDASKPDDVQTVTAGDVVHVEKGTTLTCNTTKRMKVFYVIQKELGDRNIGVLLSEETETH